MLPFLKNKKQPGVIIQERAPDHPEMQRDDDGLSACAQDLMDGIAKGNKQMIADAIRAAFQILDSEPHEEGPHLDDEEMEEYE